MLEDYKIECTECYSVTWRESKYTLIRFNRSNRIRSSALKQIMTRMHEDHGIKGSVIHGYETLSSNTKVESMINDHPGFKRMVQLLNEKSDEVRVWFKSGEDVFENKKGVFWNHIESKKPDTMSRQQLIAKVLELSKLTQQQSEIQSAHEALLAAFANQESEINRLRRQLSKEKEHSENYFNQLCSKIEECGNLKKRLIALGQSFNDL